MGLWLIYDFFLLSGLLPLLLVKHAFHKDFFFFKWCSKRRYRMHFGQRITWRTEEWEVSSKKDRVRNDLTEPQVYGLAPVVHEWVVSCRQPYQVYGIRLHRQSRLAQFNTCSCEWSQINSGGCSLAPTGLPNWAERLCLRSCCIPKDLNVLPACST